MLRFHLKTAILHPKIASSTIFFPTRKDLNSHRLYFLWWIQWLMTSEIVSTQKNIKNTASYGSLKFVVLCSYLTCILLPKRFSSIILFPKSKAWKVKVAVKPWKSMFEFLRNFWPHSPRKENMIDCVLWNTLMICKALFRSF